MLQANQMTKRARQLAGDYPSVPTALVVVFLAFIVFRYLEGGQRIEFLGRIRFELIMGAVLAVVGIVMFMKDKTRPPTAALRWAMLLALWMLAMVGMSADVAYSWNIFVDRLVKFMMIAIFIAAFVVNPTILRWFFAAYLLAFAKMAQEGIHGLVTGSLVWENQGVMRLHGPTWSYAHPNSFSGTQLGTLPYLQQFWPLAPKFLRYAMIGQAVAALAIILYCGSRTAYLGFFAWLAILIARARSSFKALAVLVFVIGLSLPFIPSQYLARLETIYTQKEIEGASIDTRKEILGDAWKIFAEHPFGVGVGAFPIVREREFGREQDTHNLYLEVATNLGFVGFVLFAGMVMSMYLTLTRLTQRINAQIAQMDRLCPPGENVEPRTRVAHAHRLDLRVMLATAQATSAFLLVRLVLGLFGHDLYEIYWWFVLGIAIALNRMEAAASRKTERLKQPSAAAPDGAQNETGRQPAWAAGR
jgi:putative inorganic carbon (hco3(-)) transporter